MKATQVAVERKATQPTRVVFWSGVAAVAAFSLILSGPRTALAAEGSSANQGYSSPSGQAQMGHEGMMGGQRYDTGTQSGMSTTGGRQAGVSVDDLDDHHVFNDSGDKIGEVDEIVRSKQNNQLSAVVEVGGFLGMGQKEVTIPLDELTLRQGRLIAPKTASTQDQLKSRTKYDESQYEEVSENQQIDRSEFAAFETGGSSSSSQGGMSRHSTEGQTGGQSGSSQQY